MRNGEFRKRVFVWTSIVLINNFFRVGSSAMERCLRVGPTKYPPDAYVGINVRHSALVTNLIIACFSYCILVYVTSVGEIT